MSEIVNVKLSNIEPNPMRQTKKYPFNPDKIEALRRSIKDVGLWEGVIGRRKSGAIQVAFGHHRVEAARKELGGDAKIPVIIRDLDDEMMLKFFGRENLEDYNADFLVMLETWEAAVKFRPHAAGNAQDLDIATLLGWTRKADGPGSRMSHTAQACASAAKLIAGGHMDRSDLVGLSVRSVNELCGRIVAQHEMVERMARATGRPAREVEQVKRAYSSAGKTVARDIRKGRVAPREIRGSVDVQVLKSARMSKPTPLFEKFAKMLHEQIVNVPTAAMVEKFKEMEKALPILTEDRDVQIVEQIGLACGHAAQRFQRWEKAFTSPKKKVTPLRAIEKK